MADALQPPRKSVELEDPGAHELTGTSDNEDDVFSDARSGVNSPIPTTRVEKVDDTPSHGEVPGTAAYNIRSQDAVPDEVEIVPDGAESRPGSRLEDYERPLTPGGTPIPRTVVQKVDPGSPSYGDIPGTAAHQVREADAVPDVVLRASDSEGPSSKAPHVNMGIPVPTTVVSKVNSEPSHGELPGTDAYNIRKQDAEPDFVEEEGNVPGLPPFPTTRSPNPNRKRQNELVADASVIAADGGFGPMIDNEAEGIDSGSDHGFGEDFDDFEEGAVDEDGFGDFDSGFQQPEEQRVEARQPVAMPARIPPSESLFPILDFTKFDTLNDIIEATSTHLDEMFPRTKEACPPAPDPIPEKSTIFLTDRSLSLWSQLVAPPPLQPPNWVRSRIRRLFLVSLGVPVDLDEILPASKQKKLILPSVHLYSSSQSPSSDGRPHGSIARLKQGNENASSASVDSSASPTKTSRKRKGPPPPPELDLAATRMLCSTTDAALLNFTDEELQLHVTRLEEWTVRASEVLEYWLKRKDDALGDKEAFEGVIENLVKHARKIRK